MKNAPPEVRPDAPEPEELPDWLSHTPEHTQTQYLLQIFQAEMVAGDDYPQSLDLDRAEYEYLKRCLAVRRGLLESSNSPEFMAEVHAAVEKARAERAAQNGGSAPTISKPAALPDWLTEVEPCSYTLCMYDPGGNQEQAVWIEHEEYLKARTVIASLRLKEGESTLAIGNKMDEEAYDKLANLERAIDECAEIVERYGHLLAEKEED